MIYDCTAAPAKTLSLAKGKLINKTADKAGDGTTTATVTPSDNRISGDVFAVSDVALFADKNVGSAKAVTVSGISLTGADAIDAIGGEVSEIIKVIDADVSFATAISGLRSRLKSAATIDRGDYRSRLRQIPQGPERLHQRDRHFRAADAHRPRGESPGGVRLSGAQ